MLSTGVDAIAAVSLIQNACFSHASGTVDIRPLRMTSLPATGHGGDDTCRPPANSADPPLWRTRRSAARSDADQHDANNQPLHPGWVHDNRRIRRRDPARATRLTDAITAPDTRRRQRQSVEATASRRFGVHPSAHSMARLACPRR